jgi:hypothetical protein
LIKLTILSGIATNSGETLPVRITSIRGHSLRGKLTCKPVTAALAWLAVGSPVEFTSGQIHSVVPKVDRLSQGTRKPVARE